MMSTNQKTKAAAGARLRRTRSRDMKRVVDTLDRNERTLSWLAGKLGLTRQAVSLWHTVPDEYVPHVARHTGLSYDEVSAGYAERMKTAMIKLKKIIEKS